VDSLVDGAILATTTNQLNQEPASGCLLIQFKYNENPSMGKEDPEEEKGKSEDIP
jgi:hypothetical protein